MENFDGEDEHCGRGGPSDYRSGEGHAILRSGYSIGGQFRILKSDYNGGDKKGRHGQIDPQRFVSTAVYRSYVRARPNLTINPQRRLRSS